MVVWHRCQVVRSPPPLTLTLSTNDLTAAFVEEILATIQFPPFFYYPPSIVVSKLSFPIIAQILLRHLILPSTALHLDGIVGSCS